RMETTGDNPMPYAVYVDKNDTVWLSNFGANAIVQFDPIKEKFNELLYLLQGPMSVKSWEDQERYGEQNLEQISW
ncbi:MAG TPA: hypothetical protein VN922_21215, partial [Bacteroidia bacterium]|nr:hypothetical protein [Bacteroidia bacterium]